MTEKAEQGLYPSCVPLGYINNKATRLIEIDEESAPYIKRAFSLMATGSYSIQMLECKLYAEGLRNRNGKQVGKSAIHQILKNPIFYGTFRCGGKMYVGSHTPIISKQLFNNVQDVLNGTFHPSIHKRKFHFNNLMICGVCGCKVIGEKKKNKYKYYHCTFPKGRHKEGGEYAREEKLAEMFEEPVRKITLNDDITGNGS